MPQVGNLARYIRRISGESNPGEGNTEGGVAAPVDLLGIGAKQNLTFHEKGVTLEKAMELHGEEFNARVAELNAMLPPEEANDANAQRLNYNQAINEVFGDVVFDYSVLLRKLSDNLTQLETRVSELENPGSGL